MKVVKYMNNLRKVKNAFKIALGAVVFLIGLILFIKSYEFADYGEGGKEVTFNSDYIIIILVGVVISVLGIISFYNENKLYQTIGGITASCIISFYSLGVFFKPLSKALFDAKKKFVFESYQWYLYIGLICLVLLVYYILDFFMQRKNNK